jgi:hypothetical protein
MHPQASIQNSEALYVRMRERRDPEPRAAADPGRGIETRASSAAEFILSSIRPYFSSALEVRGGTGRGWPGFAGM